MPFSALASHPPEKLQPKRLPLQWDFVPPTLSSQKMFGVRQLNHVPTESDHARNGVVQDDSIVSIDDGSDNVANPVGQGQSPRLTSRQCDGVASARISGPSGSTNCNRAEIGWLGRCSRSV